MPKSKVRKKTVYTPPQRSSKAKVSPPWLAPLMVGCMLVGLAWIAAFYISGQSLPVSALHQWNLVVGFALIVVGVVLATRWQ